MARNSNQSFVDLKLTSYNLKESSYQRAVVRFADSTPRGCGVFRGSLPLTLGFMPSSASRTVHGKS